MQSCNSLCKDLRKSNASKHIGFVPNPISKPLLLHVILNAYLYYCSTVNRYAIHYFVLEYQQSRDKTRSRSVDTVVETSQDVRRKLFVHACIIGLPALTRSCVWTRISSPSCYVTEKSEGTCGQFQTSIWKRKQWWEFGNKNNYLQSPIPWFQAGVNLGAANWLVTRLESRCERARCEKTTPVVFGSFLLTCPLQTWLTAIRRCCKQLLNLISCQKWFCIHLYVQRRGVFLHS